jgi:hypothetical protein
MTSPAFSFFARRKPSAKSVSQNGKRPQHGGRGLLSWRRRSRELTTFHKCLAVHMYYASSPHRARD